MNAQYRVVISGDGSHRNPDGSITPTKFKKYYKVTAPMGCEASMAAIKLLNAEETDRVKYAITDIRATCLQCPHCSRSGNYSGRRFCQCRACDTADALRGLSGSLNEEVIQRDAEIVAMLQAARSKLYQSAISAEIINEWLTK